MSQSKKDQPYTSKLRGVSALLGEISTPTTAAVEVAISDIVLPSEQPRRYFDSEKLKQLATSIEQHGILEPLLVRPHRSGKYELVAGERRYRAAQSIGLALIPIINKELSDSEALQLSLIENLQREDLNPVEETEGILQLLALDLDKSVDEITKLLYRLNNEVKGNVNHNVMVSSDVQKLFLVFESLGMMSWQSFVANRLPVLKLPADILESIRQGKIAYTKAQVIARIKDETQRQQLLTQAIAENLSLAEIRARIKKPIAHKETSESSLSLKVRLKEATTKLQKASFWKQPDSEKHKAVETLLSQIESLLADDS